LPVAGAIQDIRGPVEIPTVTPWLHRLLLILVVLAVLALIWWALRRRARHQAEFRESAAARARARLSEAWAWIEQPERFCTRLSGVVRVYLEERFGLKAPDQTTEEFLAALQQDTGLDARLRPLLEDFLTQCDWVKFAQGDPGRVECERLHQLASRLIDETALVSGVRTQENGGGRR
jgi:cbb3-type cytochrome oxidase subunit 3